MTKLLGRINPKDTVTIYKGTIIYSIGNFSSKLISLLFFPIYSYFLSTTELGAYDLIVASLSLLMPLFTLHIPESVVKFLGEEESDRVISTSIIIGFSCFICTLMISSVYLVYQKLNIVLSIWLSIQIINRYLLFITRGIGNILRYSISSIVSSIVSVVSNVLFLIILRKGLIALIYAGILSEIALLFYLLIDGKILKYFKVSNFSIQLLKKMIHFSLPLVPSGMIWWIMNSSDKFIINYYMGLSNNGIYAMSQKFPSVIVILYGFYNLSWQDFIYRQREKTDYKVIINQFLSLLIYGSVCIMFVAKIIIQNFVESSFADSIHYIPPLIVGMMFYCFAGFLGVFYRKTGKTNKEFYSSILGAILNIIINLILIRQIGLWAACLSTMLAFVAVFILRYKDTKEYFRFSLLKFGNFLNLLYLFGMVLCYYLGGVKFSVANMFLSLLAFVSVNRNIMLEIVKIVKRR